MGSYLIKLLYQVNTVTCAMFLTAMVGNPLVIKIVSSYGINISWSTWALGAIVPGLINLALLPLMVYMLYPPLIKNTPGAREFAKKKIEELGKITKKEKTMIAIFIGLIFLWVGGDYLGINSTTAAFIGVSVLLITKVLDWDDIIKESVAWDTFIWMAVLVTFSMQLATFGITNWFSDYITALVKNFNWVLGCICLGLIYFYIHYFFASITARISSLLGIFLGVCVSLGAPPLVAALFLAYLSCLGAGLTHYGTSIAPIFFSSGYVTIKDWWRVGGIISIFNFVIWLGVGSIWWKFLGYW
jgi:DASS family divalent anion:Na+ symporter